MDGNKGTKRLEAMETKVATLTYKDGQGGFIANSATIDGDTLIFAGTSATAPPAVEMEGNAEPSRSVL